MKTKTIITLLLCITCSLFIVGGSYTYWYKDIKTGNSSLAVYSSEIEFLESDTEIISIENAFPMLDELGMKQAESFDFQVKTKTKKDTAISYDLVLDKIGTKCNQIQNPTQEEYPSCYDIVITEVAKEEFMQSLYLNYGAKSKNETLYQAIIMHDDQAIYDFFVDKRYGEKKATEYLENLQNNNYEQLFYNLGVDFEYSFNEDNSFYDKFLSDGEVKLYLTDYKDNVLVKPTKISELRAKDYVIYTKKNIHSNQTEEQKDKYKLKLWVNENVNPISWNENNTFKYDFKINVKTSKMHNINVVVENGIIDDESSKKAATNDIVSFNLVPNDSKHLGVLECTNNQTATIENNILTVAQITQDTTCTVKFMSNRTVLYEDGTLIINEKGIDIENNVLLHGEPMQEYEPFSATQSYIMGYNTKIWKDSLASIKNVEVGQVIKPTSTAFWFHDCSNMEGGDFTNLNVENVTAMNSMFYAVGKDVGEVKLVGLDTWDTSNVANMMAMFGYSGNNSISWDIGDISSWDTSSVTSMYGMFEAVAAVNASSWNILDLSNWDTSSVTSMYGMFSNAGKNSKEWYIGDLSNWDTSSVSSMQWMFYGAGQNAVSWDIGDLSNWDTSNVTNMYNMFAGAGQSASVFDIGNLSRWNTSNVITMSHMFNNAGYNATVWNVGNLSNWDTSNVVNMEFMFCSSGVKAKNWNIGNLSNWNVSNVTSMSRFFTSSGTEATEWYIGDLSNWDTSSVTDMNFAFHTAGYNAEEWSIGDLSNWDTSSVVSMSHMFYNSGHKSLNWNIGNLSNWDVSKVTNMEGLFDGAGLNATRWYIGDLSKWDVSSVDRMKNMFYAAGGQAEEWDIGNLSKWDVSSVTTMYGMFAYSGQKTTDYIIAGLEHWNTSNVTDMDRMFYASGYYSNSWNVGNISSWNTSNVTNMREMFANAGYKSNYSLDLSGWTVSSVVNYADFNSGVTSKITPPVWVN